MATLNNCSHSSLPTSISMKNSSVLQVKDRKLETLGKGIPGKLGYVELKTVYFLLRLLFHLHFLVNI